MASNGGVDECPGVEAETSFEVLLYIYDLSKELAKSFKKILKGKPLPGIWHTGLVAYGREYFFGSSGIESCRPGETILGEPDQILKLGKTELPYSVFLEYIFALGESSYKPGSYNLLERNGNFFSQEVSTFLTGGAIPQEIRDLPQEILGNKNLSGALKEYFDKLILRVEGSKGISFGSPASIIRNSEESPPTVNGHSAEPEPQPKVSQPQNGSSKGKKSKMAAANGTPKAEKVVTDANANEAAAVQRNGEANGTRKASVEAVNTAKPPEETGTPNTDEVAPSQPAGERRPSDDDAPLSTFTSRRSRKYDDPPIFFQDIDGVAILKNLLTMVDGKLNSEEVSAMHEVMEYLTSEGGAWALGTNHLLALSRFLNDRNLPSEVPVLMLRVLQFAALKEDIILLLHQDRRDHYVMSYLYKIENLPPDEQEEIATFMCNLCCNNSSFDWLMYISEWEEDGHSCNNSKVTVRVAVNSLLNERPSTQDKGCSLVFNLALKELFDDVATELAMAVLQFLQGDLNEDLAFRSLTALLRFMCISYNDVPALLKMLGPDVRKFSGMSDRVNQLVEEIQIKLSVSA